MNRTLNIKYYISYHKPCYTINSGSVIPVFQSDLTAFLMQGSEEDCLMASRANEYCELLTQYWAWKYEKNDFYGFGHYRRYLLFFSEASDFADGDGIVRRKYLCDETAEELHLADDTALKNYVSQYDVIAPYPIDYYFKSVRWQYAKAEELRADDLSLITAIIQNDYPEYYADAVKFLNGHRVWFCNMFVMRKELFYEYSEWLFGILKRFYDKKDMHAEGYGPEALRTPGHLGERLFGIYLTHLEKRGGIRIAYRPMAVFSDTERLLPLEPAYRERYAVAIPASDETAVFDAVKLCSVVSASNAKSCCEIAVLYGELSDANKERFRRIAALTPNVALHFIDVGKILFPWTESTVGNISNAAMLNCLPYIFSRYDKVLWLGGRILLRRGVAELFALKRSKFTVDCISAKGQIYLYDFKLPHSVNDDKYSGEKFEVCEGDFSAECEKFFEFLPCGRRELWPKNKKRYSQLFWSLFEKTPYSELPRKTCIPKKISLFWRILFKIFPKKRKIGILARKAYRFFHKKKK